MAGFWRPLLSNYLLDKQEPAQVLKVAMRSRIGLLVAYVTLSLASCGGDDNTTGPMNPPSVCDPSDTPPVITAQPDTAVSVGDTLFLTATATDADADVLEYNAVVELRWIEWRTWVFPQAHMDEVSGRFWFAPSLRDARGRRISFIADDGRCGRDTTEFFVRVDSAAR